jgi:hypothetical protein
MCGKFSRAGSGVRKAELAGERLIAWAMSSRRTAARSADGTAVRRRQMAVRAEARCRPVRREQMAKSAQG